MEIEAKLGIPDEETFRRLLDATELARFSLGVVSVTRLHDRYLDTAGGVILAAGYACRMRREGERYLVTLKGVGEASGAIHRRLEYKVELPCSDPLPVPLAPQDWPSSDARTLALQLCDQEPLVLLFEIEQIRHSRVLYEGERAFAELTLDRVHMRRGEGMAAIYLELEAELLPGGTLRDLQTLTTELQNAWGLTPESRSKFERALALNKESQQTMAESPLSQERPFVEPLLPEPPLQSVELPQRPGIEPDDPMSEAGRKTLRLHYRQMVYHEPGTRLGEDIEALHDMRVATRRMRAAFRVFGEYFEPKAVAPYLKGLKHTGRALGRVRDLDVFRTKIHAYQVELPPGSLDGLLAALETQRNVTRERMLAYLDGEKYARFKERFGQFVETEGLGSRPITLDDGEPRPYRVRHVVPVAIYERLAAVRAYDEWVTMSDPPLKRLHALRIACKRLRYTLEFFREVLGPDTKKIIRKVVTLQDHLGNLQDAVVASDILRDFLTWGTWGPQAAHVPPPEAPLSDPGVEAYLAAQQIKLEHLVHTFPEVWQQLWDVEFSRMVAESVSVL